MKKAPAEADALVTSACANGASLVLDALHEEKLDRRCSVALRQVCVLVVQVSASLGISTCKEQKANGSGAVVAVNLLALAFNRAQECRTRDRHPLTPWG